MHYGPMSYYGLGLVLRDRLRAPPPRPHLRRRRRFLDINIPGDRGFGSDAVVLHAFPESSDVGVGADAASVPTAELEADDAGVGIDGVSVTVKVEVDDTGSGADATSFALLLTVGDTGTGADVVGASALLEADDVGAGADVAAVAAFIVLQDSGAGFDAASVTALLEVDDTGSGVDVAAQAIGPAPYDPLPKGWMFYILSTSSTGAVTGIPEPASATFFQTVGGLGLYRYTRVPAFPSPGTAFVEHGLVAAIQGVVDSPNMAASIRFLPAPMMVDPKADSFVLDITVGVRGSDDAASYYGGRVQATWSAGVWTDPFTLTAVQAAGAVPATLATATIDAGVDSAAMWTGSESELRVIAQETTVTVLFNGIVSLTIDAPKTSGNPIIMVRAYNVYGSVWVPVPSVINVAAWSLRDPARVVRGAALVNKSSIVVPVLPTLSMPIPDLSLKGFIVQRDVSTWEFVQSVYVEVGGVNTLWNVGDRIRATEPFVGQALVPVTTV